MLGFTNWEGEIVDTFTNYTMDVLKKYNLSNKIVALLCDNCNINFGGVTTNGTKDVFTILKKNLETNISDTGCASHIF